MKWGLKTMVWLLCGMLLANVSWATDEIMVQHYNDPHQKTFAYAGKLYWDVRNQRWQKKIVVYNGNPEPAKHHPIWAYVNAMKVPEKPGVKGRDLYYKRFYREANCAGKTPLAAGQSWMINFDRLGHGPYTEADFRRDWHCPKWAMGKNLLRIVQGDHAHQGNVLRVHYPKGRAGCPNPKQCVNWKPDLGERFQQLYYGFRFQLSPGFEFVKGGKLPGIAGGKANTNARKPTGADGWSVRLMWDMNGRLIQYVYHPDQPSHYGDIMPMDVETLKPGKWYSVQTMVRLNTPSQSNGAIKTWLDGKLVLNRQDMRFRDVEGLDIDRLLFSTFFGGSGAEFAPRRDQYAFFDDFWLARQPVFFK